VKVTCEGQVCYPTRNFTSAFNPSS